MQTRSSDPRASVNNNECRDILRTPVSYCCTCDFQSASQQLPSWAGVSLLSRSRARSMVQLSPRDDSINLEECLDVSIRSHTAQAPDDYDYTWASGLERCVRGHAASGALSANYGQVPSPARMLTKDSPATCSYPLIDRKPISSGMCGVEDPCSRESGLHLGSLRVGTSKSLRCRLLDRESCSVIS
jgi:hypothetical protein